VVPLRWVISQIPSANQSGLERAALTIAVQPSDFRLLCTKTYGHKMKAGYAVCLGDLAINAAAFRQTYFVLCSAFCRVRIIPTALFALRFSMQPYSRR
jgi:hypothetical protein